jgi:hypothetical protein
VLTEATQATGQEIHAMRRLRRAQQQLEQMKERSFCCSANQKAYVANAKKEVKRWTKWLEDNAVLSGAAEE